MKTLIIAVVVGVALSMPFDAMKSVQDKFEKKLQQVRKINNGDFTWKAKFYDRDFALGVKPGYKDIKGVEKKFSPNEFATLPTTFDVRDTWPACTPTFNNIRNQGQCGSCWAVSSASVFSDRKCISSGGAVQVSFSGEDTLSCCHEMGSAGCDGGYPLAAWNWFTRTGVVTGGNYSSDWGCKPYTFCSPTAMICHTPSCVNTCFGSLPANDFSADKHMASSAYRITADAVDMQKEIYSQGSIVVTFAVYNDFYSYTSGVYQKSPGATLDGYHAVRAVGWGVENGVDYWLIANSWGTDWGINGFFKIVRGVDECEIEDNPTAGLVPPNP